MQQQDGKERPMSALAKLSDGSLDIGALRLFVGVHDDVFIIGRNENGEVHRFEAYYIDELPQDECWSIHHGGVTIQIGRESLQSYEARDTKNEEK